MKKSCFSIAFSALTLAATLAAPTAAFAQSNHPLTRAEVRADLARVERAGYRPNASQYNYPDNIQAAERRIHDAPVGAAQ
ncbi:MAG: DUF4148 domain-containing protein [Janthinobacterium lividum]